MFKNSSKKKFQKKQAGFTIVEIASVLVVIGLLIGGVLKGAELIGNAKVNTAIKYIQQAESAALSFKDFYGFMPGDISAARAPNCDATTNCVGGNQNGAVASTIGVDNFNWQSSLPAAGATMESHMFWKHLALADILSSVDERANPANPQWNATHPSTPLGGGFEFYYDGFIAIGPPGHILRISADGIFNTLGTVSGVLTPQQSARIDRKIDDGHPNEGLIFSDYGTNANACKTAAVYNESAENAVCSLFVSLFKRTN